MSDLLARIRPPTTPALVILEPALRANLLAMQRACEAAGVALRAHAKMHKSSRLARLQADVGARGACAQTVDEAEALVRGGVGDVLVTAPASPRKAERIAALARSGALSVTVDDLVLAQALSEAMDGRSDRLSVVIDVDLGQRRTGALPGEAPALAREVAALPGLRLRGVQGYLGHLQHIAGREPRRAAVAEAIRPLAELGALLRELGVEAPLVTGGGTGTFAIDFEIGVLNEIQAGSYAFMDVEYGDCEPPGEGPWPFEPALFLVASVVSARHPSHVVVDAGTKALSADGPAARPVFGAAPGSVFRFMGDEHGALFHPTALERLRAARDPVSFSQAVGAMDEDLPWPADAPRLGDLVFLQPGHCDPTVNLHEAYYLADASGALSRIPIDARRTAPRA